MNKASYNIVNNTKTEGGRYPQILEGSEIIVNISFKKSGISHKVILTYSWVVDSDMIEGSMVNCSTWAVDTDASTHEALSALKESFPEFKVPKGSNSSVEDEISNLENYLDKSGFSKE